MPVPPQAGMPVPPNASAEADPTDHLAGTHHRPMLYTLAFSSSNGDEMLRTSPAIAAALSALLFLSTTAASAQPATAPAGVLVVRGETVYTMAGEPIKDGVVL